MHKQEAKEQLMHKLKQENIAESRKTWRQFGSNATNITYDQRSYEINHEVFSFNGGCIP